MDENLVRLAKILFNNLNPGTRWSETDREYYVRAVKSVINGMRTPTQKQYDTLSWKGKMWTEINSQIVWETYIDALVDDNAKSI